MVDTREGACVITQASPMLFTSEAEVAEELSDKLPARYPSDSSQAFLGGLLGVSAVRDIPCTFACVHCYCLGSAQCHEVSIAFLGVSPHPWRHGCTTRAASCVRLRVTVSGRGHT